MPLPPVRPLHGLVAATHTPFHDDGSLNLDAVERQCEHLVANRVAAAFIGGTTGESSSLTCDERRQLAERWGAVVRGTPLRLVVHVGANCVEDAKSLARHAETVGAEAISALTPSYFKPRSLDILIQTMTEIAAAAPGTPFYFYDIPSMTGVQLPMPDFLAQAQHRIPTLTGLKFTNSDLMAYQHCLRADAGRWDVPWGIDEYLLGALALGARGAVGSTYNFCAPMARRTMAAFAVNDFVTARDEQYRSVQVIQLLGSFGYMGAAKATMEQLGVPVGPPRLPNGALTPQQKLELRGRLEAIGFFDWLA